MRRRILVLAILLLPVLLIVHLLGGSSGATQPRATPDASATSSATGGTGPTVAASDSGTASSDTRTSASRSGRAPATQTTPAPIASLSANAHVTPLDTRTATAKATASRTPTLPDCRDGSIGISVATDATTYPVGNPVSIAMRISNTGTQDCMRDIGSLPNEVWVTDANGVVMWTSDACQASATSQVVDLTPGRAFGNTQVWNGTDSGRTCTTTAQPAPAGNYVAYARNDKVTSQGYAFTIG